jgi:GNAT superfamily N-acetyltransferase
MLFSKPKIRKTETAQQIRIETCPETNERLIEEHALYVPGWSLLGWARMYHIERAAYFYERGVPVAVACKIHGIWSCHVAVFVKPAYRRRGIGSLLLSQIKEPGDCAWEGVAGSEKFFEKNEIKCT